MGNAIDEIRTKYKVILKLELIGFRNAQEKNTHVRRGTYRVNNSSGVRVLLISPFWILTFVVVRGSSSKTDLI